jgi:dTDP-4-dehydrorhamnose 3,5-epimerase
MPFHSTPFTGLFIFEPVVFQDSRGYFFESYNSKVYTQQGIDTVFVQDNQSRSAYGVIRGLHFQKAPYAQTKLVRVLQGAILDVVVDIRVGSPTFGKTYSAELSAENRKQLFIPKGFAHGFSVLSPYAEILYKCDAYYHKESEAGIRYNDLSLGIDWKVPEDRVVVSEKDAALPSFDESRKSFT